MLISKSDSAAIFVKTALFPRHMLECDWKVLCLPLLLSGLTMLSLTTTSNKGRVPKIFKTAEECREACVALKDCTGFVFVKSDINKHNCAVKSKLDPAQGSDANCCDSGRVTEKCREKGVLI